MKRREMIRTTAAVAAAALLNRAGSQRALAQTLPAPPLALEIDYNKPGNLLPANFTGLGYEISSVARKDLLSSRNAVYVQMVRTLGTSGVVRVGGNTSDFSRYAATGSSVSSPKETVVTATDLRDLGSFLKATGWQLIWGLNLGSDRTPEALGNALDQAEAVVKAAGPHLLAIEIGNEPDLFGIEHRPKPYLYENFRREFEPVRDALLRRLPNVPLAGPDVAGADDWVPRFAADERSNLRLLTRHYYRGGQSSPGSTAARLLAIDPGLSSMLAHMRAASTAAGLPFRLCEVNSFSGGGRPGVSDTLTQALWVLDYMLRTAAGGAAGVNIETGVNQLGFISSYSPIGDDEHDRYIAAPGFYGMLAFAQIFASRAPADPQQPLLSSNSVATGGGSCLLPVQLSPGSLNLAAYAVARPDGEVVVVLINREASIPATLQLPERPGFRATILRLEGPGLSAKTGVTLGGVTVAPSGTWHAPPWKPLAARSGQVLIDLPAASAALLRFST